MTGLRVAIAGAGIGGLTAALALSPIAGEITLLERRTGFGETGAGIQLSPNASRILISFGLGSVLRRLASEPDRMVVRSMRSGREVGAVGLGRGAAERFGAPYWLIARSDLHTALLDAVRSRPNVRLRVGRSLSALQDGPEEVLVSSNLATGGQEDMRADLLVGADGLWSPVRSAAGDRRTPVYSGYAAYRAMVPRDLVPAALAGNDGGLWLGRGRHVVHYPIGQGRNMNIVAVERGLREFQGWTSDREPVRMHESFASAARPLRELMAAAEVWSAWSLFDLPARTMARGRVALVGDAAHPALPFLAQGGALAIEDAAVLAAELGRPGVAVGAALGRYAARRLDRARRAQTQSRRNASIYHAGGLVAAARDLVIRRAGPDGMIARYDWLYGWTPERG